MTCYSGTEVSKSYFIKYPYEHITREVLFNLIDYHDLTRGKQNNVTYGDLLKGAQEMKAFDIALFKYLTFAKSKVSQFLAQNVINNILTITHLITL